MNLKATTESKRSTSPPLCHKPTAQDICTHPRQRVKAKWNSDFRFGGKSAAASNKASHAASQSLLFSFVLDTFQAISVIFFNSTGTRRRISDLWFVGEENL